MNARIVKVLVPNVSLLLQLVLNVKKDTIILKILASLNALKEPTRPMQMSPPQEDIGSVSLALIFARPVLHLMNVLLAMRIAISSTECVSKNNALKAILKTTPCKLVSSALPLA